MILSLVSIPVQNPIEAHELYTSKLGFITKEFNPELNLAIVASSEDPQGVSILLEPCKGTFAESYQTSAYKANLPIMIFSTQNVETELERLKAQGVKLRPELNNPEWGLMNMFEDGCGNILMLEEKSA
ncbi:VOC family protein [Thalassotalea sp. ND16A]|uniref:VOC family protein n=1 Tax=Thalassotalea sp. ND16A TaxID=1535422 RepID=UPI00051A5FD2|nr:VOC family protein [Thalassotalea sp. ND16A]